MLVMIEYMGNLNREIETVKKKSTKWKFWN